MAEIIEVDWQFSATACDLILTPVKRTHLRVVELILESHKREANFRIRYNSRVDSV